MRAMKRTMRFNLLTAVAVCLILNVAAAGLTKQKTIAVTGWVSDENCGAQHTKPGGEDCVRKCLMGGAHVGHPEWKPQRMVFVTDDGKKIWVVENPAALKGLEGKHIKIKGRLNTARKTIRVTSSEALKEEVGTL